ncbi:MAG: PqqD family peptide modification chaperone [Clostridia bacterium]|nr:PqqD family peptide modification chaperone [Clostridia bacterium]
MRIKEGFELKNIHGENIIVYNGDAVKDFTRSISLSANSAFLWSKLKEGEKSKEELLGLLLENYDISTVLALNDIDIFVKTLKKDGIIEE